MQEIIDEQEYQKVLDFIKEYLKKKPFFSIEEIVDYIHQRFKSSQYANKNFIERIVKILIKQKMIVFGTKLLKEDILETPKRNEIYDFVCKNPGTIISEIMNETETGANHTLWHLKFLYNFQFIRMSVIGKKKAYFNSNLDHRFDTLRFYFRNDRIIKITELLNNSKDGLTVSKVGELLGYHFKTTKKYLDILKELDIIVISKENGKNIYFIKIKNYNRALSIKNDLENETPKREIE